MDIVEAVLDFVDVLLSGRVSVKTILWILGIVAVIVAVVVVLLH